MEVLVIGGTRYFGIPMIRKMLSDGHNITIATRGLTPDFFGDDVRRLKLDLNDELSVRNALKGRSYDVVIDKMGYCSNEIKWILESLECERFVHMSTAGVYHLDHFNIKEEEFDGREGKLVWCNRNELSYDDVKRNAERALCQVFNNINWASLRVPFVLGRGDYTKRLRFYVEHVVNQTPMFIDNLDARFCVAYREEVSDLLILLAKNNIKGPVNGCSEKLVSIQEILDYVESITGKMPIVNERGDPAPYNGTKDNSLDTSRAKCMGMVFSDLRNWLFPLLDEYVYKVGNDDV